MAGHPPELSTEQIATLVKRRAEGVTYAKIAEEAAAGELGVPAFNVHLDTVREHAPDPPRIDRDVSEAFTERQERLRAASEANLDATLKAIEDNDWKRVDGLMKARGALTQAIKGFMVSRDLYRAPVTENGESGAKGKAATLFDRLAATEPNVTKNAEDGGERDEKGDDAGTAADADATSADQGVRAREQGGPELDLQTEPVDLAA